MDSVAGLFNYWIVIALMMMGFYMVISQHNLIKKIVGLNVFQVSVFVFYITMGKVKGGTAPILGDGYEVFSNPLPHVLILTAIVVGVATSALALALTVRIQEAYGTIEEDEIADIENGKTVEVVTDGKPEQKAETNNNNKPEQTGETPTS